MYHGALRKRPLLLVFDNARDRGQVQDLLPDPPSAAIVTSRSALALPGATPVPLGTLPPGEAVDLLRAILKDRVATDGAVADNLDKLAAACGHLPLALRLAGSYLAVSPIVTVEGYLERLGGMKLERFKRDAKDLEDPALDVEAVLELSLIQLAEHDADLARRWKTLGVFPASFDPYAAAAVLSSSIEDAVDSLGRRSLVNRDAATGRFSLHDLLRELAWSKLDNKEHKAIESKLAYLGVDILRQCGQIYASGENGLTDGLRKFDENSSIIYTASDIVALRMNAEAKFAQLACEFNSKAPMISNMRLSKQDALIWSRRQLDAGVKEGNILWQNVALGNIGTALNSLGNYHEAIHYHIRSRNMSLFRDDLSSYLEDIINIAASLINIKKYPEAADYIDHALYCNTYCKSDFHQCRILRYIVETLRSTNQRRHSIRYHYDRIDVAKKLKNKFLTCNAFGDLGNCYHEINLQLLAIKYFKLQLHLALSMNWRQREGNAYHGLGVSWASLGNHKKAVEFLKLCIAARELDKDIFGIANCQYNLALSTEMIFKTEEAMLIMLTSYKQLKI